MSCPRCNSTGSMPTRLPGETRTYPLCIGSGSLPPVRAIQEDDKWLALDYWECSCSITRFGVCLTYVHPTNHEYCEKCGMKAEEAPLALAGYARAFLEAFYNMEISIEFLGEGEEANEDSV